MKNMLRLSWHNLLLSCLLFNLNFQVIFSSHNSSFASGSVKLCSPEQSSALLHLKSAFTVGNYSFTEDCVKYSYPKTKSWKEGSDCCSWDGVSCDSFTGHVIGLDLSSSLLHGTVNDNSSLFLLHHLQKLNLACNDLTQSTISSKFGGFTKLTHLNLSFSYFEGLAPTEIYHLSELVSIDLSSWYSLPLLEISQHDFVNRLQNLTKLRYLHLDSVDMSSVAPGSLVNLSYNLVSLLIGDTSLDGQFPNDIFRLPFLQKLSLRGNSYITGTLPKYNMTSTLRFLDLSMTSLSGELPEAIGDLIYLNVLDLSVAAFSGKLPDIIGNLRNLNVLDLSDNEFNGSISASIWNCTKLTSLYLSRNNFSGQVLASLSKLSQLTVLRLDNNNFSRQIPDAFGNLSKLTYVDLSFNNFNGQLPPSALNCFTQLSFAVLSHNQLEGPIPDQVSGLSNLNYLDLSDNNLYGRVPSWLFTLPALVTFYLSNNKLTGPIKEFHPSGSLVNVFLTNNQIQGSIPNSIFELVNLTTLDLSSNNLSGIVKSNMLSKLKNLENIDLSQNPSLLLVSQNNTNFTLPNLVVFNFYSCSITEFPIFLGGQENLIYLDISNNGIHGQISHHQLQLFRNLQYLNLSQNFLTSFVPFGKISMMNLSVLDLQSNLLQGPLVMLDAPHMDTFLVSNNILTGEMPSLICNWSSIKYLDLSKNRLSGAIPQCLGNSGSLLMLNLQNNNFRGSIPQQLAVSPIQYLNLKGNMLEGALPSGLVNCSRLEVLNVGNNMINETFPHWLANLPELQVLILRSNRFHGFIGEPKTKLPFPKLRILDLSHNRFTGVLPTRYFEKFNMMHWDDRNGELDYMGQFDQGKYGQNYKTGHSSIEYYSIILTVKGVDREIEKIITIFVMMDLSKNQFQGRIPSVVGKLNSLQVLNFSHNNLTGHIPLLLENLKRLESLDLSFNSFFGEIPHQLTSLSFLSVLNLSYNRLTGSIPQGNQFNTFQNDSFIGNLGLCGLPLSKKCIADEPPSPLPSINHEGEDDSSWFDWKIALMGYGCGLVIGLSMGYIVFTTGRPLWFVLMVERVRLRIITKVKRTHPVRRN